MIRDYLQNVPRTALAAALVLAIALIDWRVEANIAFGFLYLVPMILVGTVMPLWGIVATALICTVLADVFDPFAFTLSVGLPEDVLVFIALAGTGLYSREISRSRDREKKHLSMVQREAAGRRIAEEQLEFLIESSPAAILMMDSRYLILRANPSAHRLFGTEGDALSGKDVRSYIPALARVELSGAAQIYRTEMQCRGLRNDGEGFLANVFFSTYDTPLGPRLAALVLDASDELRAREELGMEQLLSASRILVAAISHEVRNVCGAIAVIHENLIRSGNLHGNQDFEALGSMLDTLNKIASLELKPSTERSQLCGIDLIETLGDLRIILDPYCEEAGISVRWNIPAELPLVWADRHRLLQVLLNLTKNSKRALEGAEIKGLEISTSVEDGRVLIRVTDTGPGIRSVENLFQPFQAGAEATGLGLYLSRALMRSLRGDLLYEPGKPGCSFIIELAMMDALEKESPEIEKHANETLTG